MARAIEIMGDIIVAPSSAFSALKERPRWALAAGCISVFSVALAVLLVPYSMQILARVLGDQPVREGALRLTEAIRSLSFFGALLVPVSLMFKWLVVSGILFSLAVLCNAHELRFTSILSVVVHAELILLIMGLVNLTIVALRGIESIRALSDLCMVPGLLTFLTPADLSRPMLTLLAGVNLFTFWYIGVLTAGVSVLTGFRRWRSALLVIIVWMTTLGFSVAVSWLAEATSIP